MIDAQLNYFDMVVIGIMLLSCIFAFFRGFVKEILSLVAWVGAAVVTIYFFKPTAEILNPYFSKPIISVVCATIALYFGSLIVFAIINRFIIKILKSGSEIGWFDNILGLAFGALRGAFIISLGYFMLSFAVEGDRPQWLEKAKTRPYVEKGTLMLVNIAPKYLEDISVLQKKTKDSVQNSMTKDLERSIYEHSEDAVDEFNDDKKDVEQNFNKLLKDLNK